MQPPDVGPVLRVDHALPPRLGITPGFVPTLEVVDPTRRGSNFDRWRQAAARGVSDHPVSRVQCCRLTLGSIDDTGGTGRVPARWRQGDNHVQLRAFVSRSERSRGQR
jgi:hypothetical protein